MCNKCDYKKLMEQKGVAPTSHRLLVLEVIGANPTPLSANAVYQTVRRSQNINKVTVYRILDLLVEKKILERLSTGDQSFRYGPAPNEHHPRHAHFYCKNCGLMECLDPALVRVDAEFLKKTYSGSIERTEIRFDGLCKNCLH